MLNFIKKVIVFFMLVLMILFVQLPLRFILQARGNLFLTIIWSIIYLLLFSLFIYIAERKYEPYSKFYQHKITRKDLLLILEAGLVFILLEVGLNSANQFFFKQQETANNMIIQNLVSSSIVILMLLSFSAVFLSPILEELVFRGYFMNAFFKPQRFWLPIFFSGVLFGLGHTNTNIISFAIYASLGMILGYTYKKVDNIRGSILLHMGNNFLAMLSMWAYLFS